MELTTCARPYARAAFQFALEKDALDNWSGMLKTGAAVVQNQAVNVLLSNPSLTGAQKADALVEVCGDALDHCGRNFVRVLAQSNRITLLPWISALFEQLKVNQEQSVDTEVISAFPLSDAQLTALTKKLKGRLQTEIKIRHTIDKSLVGGLIVRAGDLVIDSSVTTRLAKLADAMLS